MNLKEEIEKLSATAEHMCFSDSKYMRVIAIENAELIANSYAKERAWRWYIRGSYDTECSKLLSYAKFSKEWEENK